MKDDEMQESRCRPRPSETPITEGFRKWLAAALKATGNSPCSLSRSLGVGINTVAVFLRDDGRDITLGRANVIERHMRHVAGEMGVDLPPINPVFASLGGA